MASLFRWAFVCASASAKLHLPCSIEPSTPAHLPPSSPPHLYETRNDMVSDLVPKGAVIAEVGVWKGDFAAHIAGATLPFALYLIDGWPAGEDIMSGDEDGQNLTSFSGEWLHAHVRDRFASNPNVHVVRSFSQDVLPHMPVASLGAIYVDGDHTYGGAVRDLLYSVCAVKPGGWIMGHDWGTNLAKAPMDYEFGVRAAVDTMLKVTGFTLGAVANDGMMSFAVRRL